MIIIKTFEEIENLDNISEALKEELKNYFREIAKVIVGEAWQSYKLDEVGSIVVIEKADTIEILDKLGLINCGKTIPEILPEFAEKVIVDEIEMLRIVWVFGDSNGISMYCPVGKFGEKFDAWILDFLIE